MKFSRRQVLTGMGAVGVAGLGGGVSGALAAAKDEPEVGDDGLYHQDWFVESFLDLKEDLAEAAENGKHFAILWEQRGCPYCAELHKVNFRIDKIRDYVKANFNILQLDLWGPREVTDFDGKVMGERELARRWGVNFSPTMNFFPNMVSAVEGKTGKQAEIFRMPGYFKPFHFVSAFEYVRSSEFDDMQFQRFLQHKTEKMRERGEKVDMW